MYVKIEKDFSGTYTIFETDRIETTICKPMMEKTDYECGLVIPLQSSEPFPLSPAARQAIRDIFGLVCYDDVVPVTEIRPSTEAEAGETCNCNCSLKGITANGKHYITSGNIYVLNDKGQTIQKI